MKTRTKVALTALCALLLVAASVLGTLAYLTSVTGPVENTFTAGNVAITLDEADTNEAGKLLNNEVPAGVWEEGDTLAARVQGNEYHLIPGRKFVKDPTIHVDANSEDCYLFVEIDNQLAAIEGTNKIADQLAAKGWVSLSGNVYYHDTVANAGDDVVVFEELNIKGAVANAELATYGDKKITVKAYAVQAEGFDTAAAAWADTFGA